MKIFGICLIKNEADIIAETLEYAVSWCDHIIVDDNGSEDGTWEIVQELAAKHPQIIPWRQKRQPYHDKLRAEAFNDFRQLSKAGDWWTKLDSDERYVDEPRDFLSAVPARHHVVWAAQFQYYLTPEDVGQWEDWQKQGVPPPPCNERLHYYRCDYSETRFFRYRDGLKWPGSASWPVHMGLVHPRRIRNKHFQYRNPEQIQQRLTTRKLAMLEGCGTFHGYCEETDWQEKVVDSASCLDDRASNPWQVDERRIPRHLEKPLHRAVKYFMHGTGLWA
jgi:glycosyltransferase involved in cell wall biosynthesis